MVIDPEQPEEQEIEKLKEFPLLQAYQLYYMAQEYKKPDRGKWENNT